jgi:hypothetical protein
MKKLELWKSTLCTSGVLLLRSRCGPIGVTIIIISNLDETMTSAIRALFFSVVFLIADPGLAVERGTQEEAVAMVKKVIAAVKANGKDKTLAEINALEGQFRKRDLYITVLDMQGMELAHREGVVQVYHDQKYLSASGEMWSLAD